MSTFSQYSRSDSNPISPSTTFVEGLQWVTLDGSITSRISPNAKFNTLPERRLNNWDFNLGCPHPIDWSSFADWYERGVHWRGWIPEGAIGGGIIPRPSMEILPRDPMLRPLRGAEVLPSAAVEAIHRLNALRMQLKSLPGMRELGISIPGELDISLHGRLYRTSDALLTDLCRLCYHMLDLVGFFRWAACVFDEEIKRNTVKVVAETYKWLNETFTGRNIGYLIHLDASRREFGFRLCIDREVPFYYPWLPAYKTMPWLRRFDPDSLGLDPEKPGLPPAADFSPYDQYLQDVLELDNKTVNIYWLLRRTPYIVDFEGWTRRGFRLEEMHSDIMTERCYRRDVIIAGRSESACLRFYLLWRITQSEEIDDEDDEDDPRNHLDILRERHKFKCAPCEGDVYDSSMFTSSNERSCRFQIRPKSPFGSTPGPSRVPDTPNPLDIITAKSRGVPVPTSVKPSEGQTVAFGPGPSVTPGWRASDQSSPSPPTSAAGTVRQGILQEFVFLWESIND